MVMVIKVNVTSDIPIRAIRPHARRDAACLLACKTRDTDADAVCIPFTVELLLTTHTRTRILVDLGPGLELR